MKNIESKVRENKEKLMAEFPSLIEDDFDFENDEKLLIHLQQKLGKSKNEIRAIVSEKL